jgi:hypothetical protein
MTKQIPFKMAYQKDVREFVKFWSKMCNMSEQEFENKCIVANYLFDDNDEIKYNEEITIDDT